MEETVPGSSSVMGEGRGRRRFVLLPRGCSQAGMTNAGQTQLTSDIIPFPTHPVCLPGQGLQGHPGGFLPVWGEEHLSSGRVPPMPTCPVLQGDSAQRSPEKLKSKLPSEQEP